MKKYIIFFIFCFVFFVGSFIWKVYYSRKIIPDIHQNIALTVTSSKLNFESGSSDIRGIMNNTPHIVCRFPANACSCKEPDFFAITRLLCRQNEVRQIMVLVSLHNLKDVLFFKNRLSINCPIYNTSESFTEFDTLGQPYFGILDADTSMILKHVVTLSDIDTATYFPIVKKLLIQAHENR